MLAPSFVEIITLTSLTLHNLLCSKKSSRQIYCPKGLTDEEDAETGELIPGSWRSSATQMSSLPIPPTGHNPSNKAKAVRDAFMEYFCNEGSVPWQSGTLVLNNTPIKCTSQLRLYFDSSENLKLIDLLVGQSSPIIEKRNKLLMSVLVSL